MLKLWQYTTVINLRAINFHKGMTGSQGEIRGRARACDLSLPPEETLTGFAALPPKPNFYVVNSIDAIQVGSMPSSNLSLPAALSGRDVPTTPPCNSRNSLPGPLPRTTTSRPSAMHSCRRRCHSNVLVIAECTPWHHRTGRKQSLEDLPEESSLRPAKVQRIPPQPSVFGL